MYKYRVAIVSSLFHDSEFIGEIMLPVLYEPKTLYNQLNKLFIQHGGVTKDVINEKNVDIVHYPMYREVINVDTRKTYVRLYPTYQ